MNIKVPQDVIVEAVAVLLGDYSIIRKQAAILILKIALSSEFFKFLFEDKQLYPINRNDPRVRKWAKQIVSKGECELCASKENLEAHHILRWADYPQGRIDVKNGRCLCHECHTEEHKDEFVYSLMKI